SAPLVLGHGTLETPEFQRQTRDFFAAVQAAGKPAQLIVGSGYNHFEFLETLASPYGIAGRAVLQQIGLASSSRGPARIRFAASGCSKLACVLGQSAIAPLARIGPAHLSISLATKVCRYAGVRRSGATTMSPISFMRSRKAGMSMTATSAALSLATMA